MVFCKIGLSIHRAVLSTVKFVLKFGLKFDRIEYASGFYTAIQRCAHRDRAEFLLRWCRSSFSVIETIVLKKIISILADLFCHPSNQSGIKTRPQTSPGEPPKHLSVILAPV